MQQTGTYRFKRNNISGFMSHNRASTDAIKALEQWCNVHEGRKYKVMVDEDAFIIAQLFWNDKDNEAGPDLIATCHNNRVFNVLEND